MPTNENDLIVQLERAYKKLKASVYFDKTQLVLRNKIVDYEGSRNSQLEPRFRRIAKFLLSDDSLQWNNYKEQLLNSTRALTFPKTIKIKQDDTIIINDCDSSINIDKPQYFIDIDVEAQILGVLWVLTIGIQLAEDFYEDSYGNKLRKTLFKEQTDSASFSPYLFEPYYQQYEYWRDLGLEHAQKCLDNNKDVLIITLDFKEFFYSVNFTKTQFNDFYDNYLSINGTENLCVQRINDFVFEVLETYSNLFHTVYNNRVFLPIGFFPSNILSNWYLTKFDNEISKRWNPLYYGRYVDDIIIVEKIEKNNPVYAMAYSAENEISQSQIIDYYSCNFMLNNTDECYHDLALFIKDKNGEYKVNSAVFNNDPNADIRVQNNKVKLFYFKYNASRALITCFREEISKNKSEFRFLPEDGALSKADNYSEIYQMNYSDTINKLRGVDGVSIDKYALSKFLGKYFTIGNLIHDQVESKFVKDIEKIFTSQTIIENYTTWEKVLQYLAINEHFAAFELFVTKIIRAINNTNYNAEQNEFFKIQSIKKSLLYFLYSALCRSLSLVWNPEIENAIKHVFDEIDSQNTTRYNLSYLEICRYRFLYCKTRMCDKYIMPAMIDAIIDGAKEYIFEDNSKINLSVFNNFMEHANNLNYENTSYKYYPYMVTPQDISIGMALKNINAGENLLPNSILKQEINRKCILMNYGNNHGTFLEHVECINFPPSNTSSTIENASQITSSILRIGKAKRKKFKIAVANAMLHHKDFEDTLADNPNRSHNRYNKLTTIINSAIREDADLLVIPESYVPFEWLQLLARKSTQNNMAIIAGIEHIKSSKNTGKVYNLTASILPIWGDNYRYAYISFHTKVHYSPEELRNIYGYRLTPVKGNTYDLLVWNDLWFSNYCCFELSSIKDRSLFQSYVDMLAIVEWNQDVNYFSSIIDSLSRDMHCFCVQVNSSDFGDSRITQPAKTIYKDILKTKGGINETVLVGEINIHELRKFQFKEYELQKDDLLFKPTPPQFDKDIVGKKIKGTLWEHLIANYKPLI